MLHVVDLGFGVQSLPPPRWTTIAQLLVSSSVHVVAALVLTTFIRNGAVPSTPARPASSAVTPPDIRHIVFIARDPDPGGGGGGGGNRQPGPVRRGEAIGTDRITLRIAKPVSAGGDAEVPAFPEVLLDAKTLATGNVETAGLPAGGVSFGTSTGPGSGGGVGEGVGTGIGSGRGPGLGAGSGGGVGGGVYRSGGAVTPPRVITEVKPRYTTKALFEKVQGTVVLELVVRSDGVPSNIRVIQSLDPDGLDGQAIVAASQWRFEPGRLAGRPVDVLVTILLDFRIR